MRTISTLCILSVLGLACAIPDPSRFYTFLANNTASTSSLPLSYKVPDGYFASIPANQRGATANASKYDVTCKRIITAAEQNAYTFQTEQMLSMTGINLYDAAVRGIGLALLGHSEIPQAYQTNTLIAGKTLQLGQIRANGPCKGIIVKNQCNDTNQNGACGLCYGGNDGNSGISMPADGGYFFRMIGDIWSYSGTVDARCPEKNIPWIWNDWRPVTGENVWANILGPLQVAYIKYSGDVDKIPDDDSGLVLAAEILPAVQAQMIPSIGALAYAPYNTYDGVNPALGGSVSVENCASSLAALRLYSSILTKKTNTKYASLIPEINKLVSQLTGFIKTAYNPDLGYFVQGGQYTDGKFVWNTDPSSMFAVDCQTWVMSVLGVNVVDGWFGKGASLKIWETTKKMGGFQYDSGSDSVQGLGFSMNQKVQIFSGEWSFGAVNLLRCFAAQYTDPAVIKQANFEAAVIRNAIDDYLTFNIDMDGKGTRATAINYANKRYYIPWGWWSNPIPSTASTGWAVCVDKLYNPFALGGVYTAL